MGASSTIISGQSPLGLGFEVLGFRFDLRHHL
jgi:hypothetical protein